MNNALMRNRFSLLKMIPTSWKKDSLIKLYDSSVYQNPCKCTKAVYLKKKALTFRLMLLKQYDMKLNSSHRF